jgi:DNA-binding transcriptional LysR family regulator
MTTLVAFEAAARLGSFTKAAAELNLTQAAISRQIRQMEINLGCKLFERRRYDVQLNEAGRQLSALVGGALHSIADIADAIRTPHAPGDEIVIFSEMALAARRLIPRLNEFSGQYPEIQLKILTSNQPLESVGEQINVGLQYGARDPKRFDAIEICGDVIYPVAAPLIAQQITGVRGIEELNEFRLLHLEQNNLDWIDWPGFFATHDAVSKRKPGDLLFNTYSSVIEAAVNGSGIALGWGLAVEQSLKEGVLVRLGDWMQPAPEGLFAHTPKSRDKLPATQKFIAWLVDEFTN